MSHDVTWSHVERVIWLYWWKPVTVSHPLAMFVDHWSSKSGDITYLICHVTSHDHVKGYLNLWVGAHHHLATFSGQRHYGSVDIVFLIFLVIQQDRGIRGSCDFIERSPLKKVTTLPILVAIGIVVIMVAKMFQNRNFYYMFHIYII